MSHPTDWTTLISALSASSDLNPAHRASLLDDALGLGTTITTDSAGCSVTETTDLGFRTPAASNDLALELDLAQYADGDGPCLAACRDHQPHSVAIMDVEPGYTGFTAVALEHGVHSSLSLPLAGVRRASALNLYATSPAAFDNPHARRIAGLLARCVASLLPDQPGDLGVSPEDLRSAQARHDRVLRAQRELAAEQAVTPQEALRWMMQQSRTQHCSLFTIVDAVLREDSAAVDGGDS